MIKPAMKVLSAPAKQSDVELLRLMLGGDGNAFETLYERWQSSVYRFALRMSGSESTAEDVTHDVFLALIRDGGQYDEARGSLVAYLYGMTRHRVLNRLTKDKTFVSLTEEETTKGELTIGERMNEMIAQENPLNDLTRIETIDAVRQAVLALPPHYREVVVLCNLDEMTYEEAAEVIGCAVGTVRSRLHRARTMLLERLRNLRAPRAATLQQKQARFSL